jgi:hypothetical protein
VRRGARGEIVPVIGSRQRHWQGTHHPG